MVYTVALGTDAERAKPLECLLMLSSKPIGCCFYLLKTSQFLTDCRISTPQFLTGRCPTSIATLFSTTTLPERSMLQYPGGTVRLFCTKLGLSDPLGLPGNSIRTAKYTLLSFLPVNLFQQFTRVANMYFLFIAFLQLIPGLSPTSWVTTVGPLCFVLFINAIKVSQLLKACYSCALW